MRLFTPDPSESDVTERILLLFTPLLSASGVLVLTLCRISDGVCNVSLSVGSALLIVVSTAVCFGFAHSFLAKWAPNRDPFLLPVAAMLTTWGLLSVARLAPAFLGRQVLWMCVSVLTMAGVVRLKGKLDWLYRYRYSCLFAGLILLIATLFLGTNPSGYGPRLWLGFGTVYYQPSELLKLLMVVFSASYLAEKRQLLTSAELKGPLQAHRLAYIGPLFAMFGLTLILLAWQQDLGTAMIFFLTFLVILYLATKRLAYIGIGLVLFTLAGIIGYSISEHVALRIDIWLNPWPEAPDRAFQIVQSLIAIGAGGLIGQGLAMGVPTYVPAVHTDFVFAAIGEEWGLVGLLALISLFLLLVLRGFRTALRSPRLFESFLAAGLSATLGIQGWIIMAGNAKLAPITGVTIPFVSYGGSSLLTSYVALALLISVSDKSHPTKKFAVQDANFSPPLRHVVYTMSALFLSLALVSGYWAVGRTPQLTNRDDNPRKVLYERSIVRGRILDRQRVVLAESRLEGDRSVTRLYPIPQAAPVTGYTSLRYGSSGIELTFDELLRGGSIGPIESTIQQALHRNPEGHDVQLTLDAALQTKAQNSLQEYTGAVVAMNAHNGAILALASGPTFDPEQIDRDWDALVASSSSPLLNRATQALYQPGTVLQSVVLSEILIKNLATLTTTVAAAAAPIDIDGEILQCAGNVFADATLADAYSAACPAPFAEYGQQIGQNGLADAFARWGLTTPITLEIPAVVPDIDLDTLTSSSEIALEAIGQGKLTVSPLQVAIVAATLTNDGIMPAAHIVSRLQDQDERWIDIPPPVSSEQIIPSWLASAMLDSWKSEQGFLVRHSSAIPGTDQLPHQWFTGILSSPTGSSMVIVVLLENTANPDAATRIGVSLLQTLATAK